MQYSVLLDSQASETIKRSELQLYDRAPFFLCSKKESL